MEFKFELLWKNLTIEVNSGTSALYLSLLSVELKPKDGVITVPNTFIGTTNTIVKADWWDFNKG